MPSLRQPSLFVIAIAQVLVPAFGAEAPQQDPLVVLPRCPDDAAASQLVPQSLLTPDDELRFEVGEFELDADENLNLDRGIVLRQGNRELRADRLKQASEGNRIELEGEVSYHDPDVIVRGNAGSFDGGEATFEGTRFELPMKPARGGAQSLSIDRNGVLRLADVEYTTCPEGENDWLITADRISINPTRGSGTARDARVRFFGKTLLRLPAISFPVGNARKSGLLFPSIGSSTSGGVELAVPYYFNLSPQQDFTFTGTWYSNRGIDLGGQYRYLTRSSRGSVDANLLPGDDRSGDTRSRVRVESRTELPGQWRLSVDAQNVSDARYLEDFARGTDEASTPFLSRSALLAWRNDRIDLGVQWRNFQTLDAELPQADRPHTELPRIFAMGDWRLGSALPLDWGASLEAVNFRHSSDVQGWRIDAAPRLALDYNGAGWFLRPAASLHSTHYWLSHTEPDAPTRPSRTLPLLSLDAGLLFERGTGSRGQRRITLEPRLMYLYVPYREQSALPVFDTGEPDLNWVELFRDNRYAGIDRISDANQVSTGVTAELYGSRTGQRFITATIGQTYYFDRPRVRLPDEPEETGGTSDLIAQVGLAAFRNWNVDIGWQWDPQERRTERSEVRLQYRPEARSVLNFGYRFQDGRMEQLEASAAWPLSPSWRLYGRSQYSLREKKIIENFAGFEYSSCCWAVRAVARDYVGRRTGERDRSIYLQLELKGLSNVGLAADAFLERSIRGYSSQRRR